MILLLMLIIPASAQTFYESQTSCDIPMKTVEECNNAGTALGWTKDTNGITENSWSNQPPGCFRHHSYPDRWYFNINSDSEAVCTGDISGGCACLTNKPVCSGQMNDCVYQGELCEVFDDSKNIPCGAINAYESQTSCEIPITSVEQCNRIGAFLWEEDTSGATSGTWTNNPSGCFRRYNNPRVWYFNENEDPTYTLQCNVAVAGGCACLTDKPVCSSEVTTNCVYQGELCEEVDDSYDFPCGKLNIYESQTSCEIPIRSEEECTLVAKALNWTGDMNGAHTWSTTSRPHGCYSQGNWVFNPSTSALSCDTALVIGCACLTDKPTCSSEVTANCVYQGELCEVFDDSKDTPCGKLITIACSSEVTANCIYQGDVCEIFDDSKDIPCGGLTIYESHSFCDIPIRSEEECTIAGAALNWIEDTNGAHTWSTIGKTHGCWLNGLYWVFNPEETSWRCDTVGKTVCACLTDKPTCSGQMSNCLYQGEICEAFDDSYDFPCERLNSYESQTSCEIPITSAEQCNSVGAFLWEEDMNGVRVGDWTGESSGCFVKNKYLNDWFFNTNAASQFGCSVNGHGTRIACACLTDKPACSSEVTTNCVYQGDLCEVFDDSKNIPCGGQNVITVSGGTCVTPLTSADECARVSRNLGKKFVKTYQGAGARSGCWSTGTYSYFDTNPMGTCTSTKPCLCWSDLLVCSNGMRNCIYQTKICPLFFDSCVEGIEYSDEAYYNINPDGHLTVYEFNSVFMNDIQYLRPYVTSVSIENGITHIPDYVFINSPITSVQLQDTVTSIGKSAFRGSKLTDYHIPDHIQYINDEAFANIGELKSVSVPFFHNQGEGSLGMGSNVFMNCTSLETIRFRKRPAGAEIRVKAPFFNKEAVAEINTYDTGDLHYPNSNDIELFITHRGSKVVNPFVWIDIGQDSVPAFADLDNDADLDFLVGTSRGYLYYFENIGNASYANYTNRGDVFGIGLPGQNSVPAFVDMDNDKDMDLVIGRYWGTLLYYENTGNASNPSYTRREENPIDWLSLGASAPAFVDMDNDGDMDLVVGTDETTIMYYENIGNASNPYYTNRQFEENPFHEIKQSRSTPAFVDMDNDGDMDLVVGTYWGNLIYYENAGNARNPSYTKKENPFDGIDVGYDSFPAFVDMDNDGDMDLVIGRDGGNLIYYENMDSGYELIDIKTVITGVSQSGSLEWYFTNQLDPDSFSLAKVDLDGDNDDDIVITTPSRINYYENLDKSIYRLRDIPFSPLSSTSNIAFADIDRDDDFDYILLDANGDISYFENTGDKFSPQFKQQVKHCTISYSCNIFALFQGEKAFFLDYNNDGYNDLVLDGSVYLGGVEVFTNAMGANGFGLPIIENIIFEDKVPIGHFAVVANNIRYENGKQHEFIESLNGYPSCAYGCMEIVKDGTYYGDVTGFNFSGISLANSKLINISGEVAACPSAMPPNWICDTSLKRFIGPDVDLTGVDLSAYSIVSDAHPCPVLPDGFACANGIIVQELSKQELQTLYKTKQC